MLFGKEPILSAIMSSAMVLFMSSAMAHMSFEAQLRRGRRHWDKAVTGVFTAKFSKLAFRRTPLWFFAHNPHHHHTQVPNTFPARRWLTDGRERCNVHANSQRVGRKRARSRGTLRSLKVELRSSLGGAFAPGGTKVRRTRARGAHGLATLSSHNP